MLLKVLLDVAFHIGTAALFGVLWSVPVVVAIGGSPYPIEKQILMMLAILISTIALGFLMVILAINLKHAK